ncbi:MAG: hypothetical protein CL843_10920 [Crocinitomicaceae bacterium]|nr:hypothetical protein [Crocinitomicaceae bacterium]|tara:strand:- start:14275 stop:14553 length:279 start_codon:yes stop_codon:yes gene_type:complete
MHIHEVKCDQCGQWTHGKNHRCEHCGAILKEEEKKEIAVRKAKGDSIKPRFVKINEEDGWLLVIGKYVIRTGQFIFYALISFLIWITSLTIG